MRARCSGMVRLAVAAVVLLLTLAGPAAAQRVEHIREFTARIEVQPDGSVEVTEEIEVLALGHSIRRGIFRDLLLGSVDPLGLISPDFEVLEALRNGEPETHRVESRGDYVRVYLGHPDVLLQPGMYRYRLRYRMAEQVDFHEGYDEIYWNVNGTGWRFVTLRVQAEVVLPPGARILQHAAYTGYAGEQGRDFRVAGQTERSILFVTTRPLAAGENLTVAVGFPKGIVTPSDRFAWLVWLMDQDPIRVAAVLMLILFGYYTLVWFLVGRDPKAGVIVPIYQPELPPAAMRYIRRMGFDNDCVAAALLNLAVKGHLRFEEDAKNKLVLHRVLAPDGAPEPSPGEAILLHGIFGNRARVELDDKNQAILSRAKSALQQHFDKTFNRVFFRRNVGWFALGLILTVLGWIVVSLTQPELFFAFPLAAWVGGVAFMFMVVFRQFWHHLRVWRAGGESIHLITWIVCAVILVPISVFLGTAIVTTSGELGWEVSAAVLALGAVNTLFRHLLQAPTAIGRTALDEIEGTRRYLAVAEADRLRFHNPPDRTPEHFEALLPYAVALGVETDWTRQFSGVLERASAARGETEYRPHWYSGSRFSGVRLSSLGQALSSSYGSASAPKSSGSGGGSRGGGSSGGGRGGGGGGGW